jgi:HPt (histidine-containing phosphotransfer) domain-containing protein
MPKAPGPKAPAWNGKAALRAAGGSPDFLAELVTIYLKEAAATASRIARWGKEDRFGDISKEAHRLKGASLTLCLDGVATACREIEEAAARRKAALLSERTERLKAEIEAFRRTWSARTPFS